MECIHCHKLFSTRFTLKTHQKTTKSCIDIQEKNGVTVDKKLFDCSFCTKSLTTSTRLNGHLLICKQKIRQEKLTTEQNFKKLERRMEDSNREMKYSLEDEMIRVTTEVKTKQEELELELQRKEEKNRILEERIKELEEKSKLLEEKSKQPHIINNTFTGNITIFNGMSQERVTEVFDKHYTIEKLMGGQKELANFVVDQFVTGKENMVYLCVDRSRKKCMYLDNEQTLKEDINNEVLISQLTPAMSVIKDKVDWTEYEKKYNPYVDKIHDSYEDILAIPEDCTMFRSQLCRRLPATMDDKDRVGQSDFQEFDRLRESEKSAFTERREEINRIVKKETEPPREEVELVPNKICDVGLGRLDGLRLLYKNQGIYRIHKELEEAVAKDPVVAQAYEDYIKRGTYKGTVIWE